MQYETHAKKFPSGEICHFITTLRGFEKLHREDGPAQILVDGQKLYFWHGHRILYIKDNEDWANWVEECRYDNPPLSWLEKAALHREYASMTKAYEEDCAERERMKIKQSKIDDGIKLLERICNDEFDTYMASEAVRLGDRNWIVSAFSELCEEVGKSNIQEPLKVNLLQQHIADYIYNIDE